MDADLDVVRIVADYHARLADRLTIVQADLEKKRVDMVSDPFVFMRATYFLWARRFPQLCAALCKAPAVLSVGDLHVENFGTWRDIEGRLIWGINDFDEAYPLPYTNDVVRLAASVLLAIESSGLTVSPDDACRVILAGYTRALESGGRPFVLAEENLELRAMATARLKEPVKFWKKLDSQHDAEGPIPESALEALESRMPETGLKYRIIQRQAGEGRLGRQRFVALADWAGGRIAREAKALAPSANVWAGTAGPKDILYQAILKRSVRCRDPFVELRGQWIVRRLAPDCSRIELTSLPAGRDEQLLLEAMGFETGNIHLGTSGVSKAIKRDLKLRPARWLRDSAAAMAASVKEDWQRFSASIPPNSKSTAKGPAKASRRDRK